MSKSIGRDAWATLDSLAATYNANAAGDYKKILQLLPYVYPCSECRSDMTSIIETHIQKGSFVSGEAFAVLIYDLHDRVNRKLRDLEVRRFMEEFKEDNQLSTIATKLAEAVDPYAPYNRALGPRQSIPRDIYISKLCLLSYEPNKDHVWRFCEALIDSKTEANQDNVGLMVDLIVYRIFGFRVAERDSFNVPSFRLFRNKTRNGQIRSVMHRSRNRSNFISTILKMQDKGALV